MTRPETSAAEHVSGCPSCGRSAIAGHAIWCTIAPNIPVQPYRGNTCLRCGLAVGDQGIHDRWHDGMCGHRDVESGMTCMNRPPCNGPHRTDFSPHTWESRSWWTSSPHLTV